MDKWPGGQNGRNQCHRTEWRMKRNENSLKVLWDNTKCANIHIIAVPEEDERERERIWENSSRDNSWKLPEHGKGNRQPSPGSTESQEG